MPLLSPADIYAPQILAAEKDFLLVCKPPRMHSAPQARSTGGETILDWCVARFPEVAALPGRKAGEGGLLHRLDYETHGLMLLARSRTGMEALLGQQREGKIIKEYSAISAKREIALPGFPRETPVWSSEGNKGVPQKIESAFRPYGPGRKAVRPVLPAENKTLYSTEILEIVSGIDLPHCFSFRLRIWRGFRHQIRSHLAWLGLPILNDSLYGGISFGKGLLALRAVSIAFNDPSSGEEREYSIPALSGELI
ncbi:MAG: RNA pseudouridine synthase [Treponema sp.]|jgi:23S rRNA pseudouridine1911/1915/1917 synthase|nr:RNA pseudouridine synthase [Treponema sp.]